MRIIRDYILEDFLSSFIFSLLSLTGVMLLGNILKISDLVIRKGVAIQDALQIFYFYLPYALKYTLPLSLLLAILLTMGKIIANNELIAINVAGIPLSYILSIFLTIGIILSLTLFILNDKILPDFHYKYRSKLKTLFTKNIQAVIEPGIYMENFQNSVIYVEDIKDNRLINIHIYETDNQGLIRSTYAKWAKFVIDHDVLKLKLSQGVREERDPKNPQRFYKLNFKVFFMHLPVEKKEVKRPDKKASDMSIRELKQQISRFRKMQINPVEFVTELHERISFSFSPLIFTIFAFGISLVVKHREKSINFGIALLIALSYYLLLLLGETLSEFQFIHPGLGMWIPNLIIGGLGLFLFIKNAYIR